MSEVTIHPLAVVERGAELDTGVEIGPFAFIGARVRIGARTRVGAHAVVTGNTSIGEDNQIFSFASVGHIPQDLKYRGEDSRLEIGHRNIIREFATVHLGTAGGGMVTRIGDENLLMNYTHIAHDCRIGNRVIVANGVQLAGHVIVEDYAVLGALSGIHQFVRVGESAIVGAGSMVSQDVPPFCNATGNRATLHGLNLVGLQRRGFSRELVQQLKRAYRIVFRSGLTVAEAAARVRAELPGIPEVERFVHFIEHSTRGVCR
ncbi:MAG: acyl-[acyl-carrier-protein]--UDP-N-acetylglucosamine O-acyltransferase [Candidatus Binatia bacterium]|nr:MAG: acyl-[acyl-carrier-protein]--UDP-N-acetylglucosamine O-acyltransferase [Candidatus Binatia bacterium]